MMGLDKITKEASIGRGERKSKEQMLWEFKVLMYVEEKDK